jgi:hypothetical protein
MSILHKIGRASLALDCVHDLKEGMDISFGYLEKTRADGGVEKVAFECLETRSDEGYHCVDVEAGKEGSTEDNVLAGSDCGIVTRNAFGKTEISTIPGVKCVIK